MSVADKIKEKLAAELNPQKLTIIDESVKHAGHAGARPEGESHFRVEIVAEVFDGLSRVERQRRVYAALADELTGPIHALSLATLSPNEDLAQGGQ
ncbi:MAG: BolA family transcriptional regulator [Rhodospirillaceae bacterium]|jgi:BolA family transcriptional regulator, general stress-responsive regulator|nr:BolA family transcriptional regulator [Rhodospirillaceae bacterium]MBT5374513.1 BolA family transcriptional regulator [Rhodospirillaceae bacterium]MBT5658842.1 BolA family transcriptional regulator [Rhodospirillaceae bacterium]MBT5753021.1 BolA family transcriptional regulator [Rhodospirillaceae bacterium]